MDRGRLKGIEVQHIVAKGEAVQKKRIKHIGNITMNEITGEM